jgi:hypothetical protein
MMAIVIPEYEEYTSLDRLVEQIQELNSLPWRDFDSFFKKMQPSVKKDDFKTLCINKDIFYTAFKDLEYNNRYLDYSVRRILEVMLPRYSDVIDEILVKTEINQIKAMILRGGYYSDIKLIDNIALTSDGEALEAAVHFCSIKALRKLKKVKNTKARRVVLERLGPVECLDEMLSDKSKDIRSLGLARAPCNYEKLKDMTKEIAREPFTILIQKIPSDYLPMLLANRNIKNNWIAKALEKRLTIGE